ncbi:S1C family serine protease [Dinghuibacter silviterrae]|uniref:S1-C subfamily serine protease n=1 Tax=Dinghuibacter silviterrae TaxID=1539049 RepID=A0A4R8DGA5_9BACT|nr:serine protease [Dinghuibacter silviterrae]TDW96515.1 S1-C subfamily serine protease [Dinghuibacter silviterrae]
MDEVLLQNAVDRYLRMEMTQQERLVFEELRRTNPEVDQLVVAHSFFLQELERFGQLKEFKSTLNTVEAELLEEGAIKPERLTAGARVSNMWIRYRRTIAVAACIGGITAVCISGMMLAIAPKHDARLMELANKVNSVENSQRVLRQQLNEVTKTITPSPAELKVSGTSFLIDGRGYLVTSAHVVKDVSSVFVANHKGDNFKARIIFVNPLQDLAILKIEDSNWTTSGPLPYGIKRTGAELGEPIFTLGYPRNYAEIVYGEGYLSAQTGYNGDSISCQITVSANPGNSGGPVLNEKGEVVGILSTKQPQTDGVVFALNARNIYSALDSLKKDTTNTYPTIRVSSVSTIRSLDRVDQIKKIEDCVYMVKGY